MQSYRFRIPETYVSGNGMPFLQNSLITDFAF